MNDSDWVELFWLQWPKDESLDHRALEVQLAIRGYDIQRNTNPAHVRVDTVRASGPGALMRVSIHREIAEQRREVVDQTPLQRLSAPHSGEQLSRGSDVGAEDIKERLRAGTVTFVFADVGQPIGWIDPSRTFEVWKVEARSHLAELGADVDLDTFNDGYAYRASEWSTSTPGTTVILFEKVH